MLRLNINIYKVELLQRKNLTNLLILKNFKSEVASYPYFLTHYYSVNKLKASTRISVVVSMIRLRDQILILFHLRNK